MSNSVHAFFLGRALAEGLNELVEDSLTHVLSEVGKFDAEQREKLHQFTTRVQERAEHETEAVMGRRTSSPFVSVKTQPVDLQATIDELRAEIARLRAELQTYRNPTT